MSIIYGISLYVIPLLSLALPHMRKRRKLAWVLWVISAIPWVPLWIGYYSKAFSPSWAVPVIGGPFTSIVLISLFFNLTYKYWKDLSKHSDVRILVISFITIAISASIPFLIIN